MVKHKTVLSLTMMSLIGLAYSIDCEVDMSAMGEKGTYYNLKSLSYKSCPVGYKCDKSCPKPCNGGTYQDEPGKSSCKVCAVDSYTPSNGGAYLECIKCRSNEYASAGSNKCNICPHNSYPTSDGCVTCPDDQYPDLEAKTCNPIPAGSFASYSDSPTPKYSLMKCKAGTYNDKTGKHYNFPVDCKDGECYNDVCKKCNNGMYSSEDGATSCKVCPAGSFDDVLARDAYLFSVTPDYDLYYRRFGYIGTTHCTECRDNTFFPYTGAISVTPVDICIPCDSYMYSNNVTGHAKCFECKSGYYGENHQCLSCPVGKMLSINKANIPDPSSPDPGATYVSYKAYCNKCGVDEYAPPLSTSCYSCPARTYAPEGSSDISDCKFCKAGQFFNYNSKICANCEAGTTSDGKGGPCLPCSENTYALAGDSQCTPCKTGSFSVAKSSTCVANCPKGNYYDYEQKSCKPCGFGTYADKENVDTQCKACPVNKYSAIGSTSIDDCKFCSFGSAPSDDKSTCVSCNINEYSGQEGGCFPCTIGSYYPIPLANTKPSIKGYYPDFSYNQTKRLFIDSCPLCQSGSYGDVASLTYYTVNNKVIDSVNINVCRLCPLGTASSDLGAISSDTCFYCSPGYYADKQGLSSCIIAPAGTYVDTIGAIRTKLCNPGTYSSAIGATSANTCLPSPIGSYVSTTGASVPTKCPAMYYADVTGLSACKKCAANYYSAPGATKCFTCKTGYVPKLDLSGCIKKLARNLRVEDGDNNEDDGIGFLEENTW